jgi:hypothetical protein
LFYDTNRDIHIEVFTDADWAGVTRLTIGYFSLNLVAWKSQKQMWYPLFQEYRATANGVCEGKWIKSLLE